MLPYMWYLQVDMNAARPPSLSSLYEYLGGPPPFVTVSSLSRILFLFAILRILLRSSEVRARLAWQSKPSASVHIADTSRIRPRRK